MLIGKEDETLCDTILREVYRSVLGTVAWTVLTRAELAVFVQALQRRARAFRIQAQMWLQVSTVATPIEISRFYGCSFENPTRRANGLNISGIGCHSTRR